MAISHRQNRLLPRSDREYFYLWVELGTTEKVSRHLANAGEVNPKTGEAFAPMTLWRAAMRYVVDNADEVKPYFEQEQGRPFTDSEWHTFMVEKACSMFYNNRTGLKKWLRRHRVDMEVDKNRNVWEKLFYNTSLD